MPAIFENRLGVVKSWVPYAHQSQGIYQVLSYYVGFEAPEELWDPLSKTVRSKWSLFGHKRPVDIWNNRKAKK